MNLRTVCSLLMLLGCTCMMAQGQSSSGAPNPVSVNLDKPLPPIPVITGGIALNTSFEPNETVMNPVIAPIFLVPLGHHALIESEFEVESDIVHTDGDFEPVVVEKGLEYAQLDFLASKYLTVVAGRYATPFNVYKERYDARWIRNLPAEPLIFPLEDTSGNGGMLRGAVPLSDGTQVTYSGYFSALTNNNIAGAERQTGLRTALFFSGPRIETGFSFSRRLAPDQYDMFGGDFAWNIRKFPLDIRAEGLVSQAVGDGYWVEGAYRLSSSRLPRWLRRSQAVVRGEQYFTPRQPQGLELDVPDVDTGRVFTGWNYWITDSVRAGVAYGRQFAHDDNHNVWTLGISYRFVR